MVGADERGAFVGVKRERTWQHLYASILQQASSLQPQRRGWLRANVDALAERCEQRSSHAAIANAGIPVSAAFWLL